ncbi:MAG TPA: hypothetical protein VET65_13830 [Candidatus Limnocylindrales bacterium]|nr:hypothetical protein [Candidatus Limnocylindrales bacterium]
MIERTVLEIARHRFWAWQRRNAATPRSRLRETDQLLGALEECRIRRITLIPTPIWRRIVHLLGQIDARYAQRIGIDRSVELSSEVLFEAQEALMVEEQQWRRPQPNKVIPLFRR